MFSLYCYYENISHSRININISIEIIGVRDTAEQQGSQDLHGKIYRGQLRRSLRIHPITAPERQEACDTNGKIDKLKMVSNSLEIDRPVNHLLKGNFWPFNTHFMSVNSIALAYKCNPQTSANSVEVV